MSSSVCVIIMSSCFYGTCTYNPALYQLPIQVLVVLASFINSTFNVQNSKTTINSIHQSHTCALFSFKHGPPQPSPHRSFLAQRLGHSFSDDADASNMHRTCIKHASNMHCHNIYSIILNYGIIIQYSIVT